MEAGSDTQESQMICAEIKLISGEVTPTQQQLMHAVPASILMTHSY